MTTQAPPLKPIPIESLNWSLDEASDDGQSALITADIMVSPDGARAGGGTICRVWTPNKDQTNTLARMLMHYKRLVKAVELAQELPDLIVMAVDNEASQEQRCSAIDQCAAIGQELRDVLAAVKGGGDDHA